MMNIEDMEKMIQTMRTQAQALNTTADNLELMLTPYKQQAQAWEAMQGNMTAFMKLFQIKT